ncbi:hypothetical protein HanHA300_Chr00c1022g0832911 [Helianthus annuus]|nr:hypothetical protein HanHA89_Chr16g0656851 [Helianthus annuus]KAJ0620415.1 hypothetical protein HanHA300_Chr00c1022g0832911 [Helianthus annuus]KAJ0640559.1 hypothetical protein HanLR1_Chr16g0616881 [Helianthus annuus]KAJ0644492.1 hypothetical protein HanOQP8_Chr16g0612711 [Helianthus annuus]
MGDKACKIRSPGTRVAENGLGKWSEHSKEIQQRFSKREAVADGLLAVADAPLVPTP